MSTTATPQNPRTAIYQNISRPEPVSVDIMETLPSGRVWVRFPGNVYRCVKASSLRANKEAGK